MRCFWTFTLALLIPSVSLAQDPGDDLPVTENLTALEADKASEAAQADERVLIITAQKRKQSIHQVPLAVSAYGEEQLVEDRVNDLADIAELAPSFSLGQFNIGQPQLYIRGIGSNEDGAGGDASTVVFVDGVYMGRSSAALFDFFDIARVEVLRGPQGTLYGKNVVGGAINIISRNASEIAEDKLSVSLGSDNLYQLNSLNVFKWGSERDNFAKVALLKAEQDGYIESIHGFKLNGRNDLGLRGQFETFTENNGRWAVNFDLIRQRQSGAGRHPHGGLLGDVVLPSVNAAWANDYLLSFADVKGFQDKDLQGISVDGQWHSAWGQIDSISAWRRHEFGFLNDDLAVSPAESNLDILNGGQEVARQWSQELRLSGQWQNQWDWLAGAYFYQEQANREEFFSANILPTGTSWQDNQTQSYALFSHLIYQLNEQLSLTLGARQTWEKKSVEQAGEAGFVISETYQVKNHQSWQGFTPKLALAYQPDQQNLWFVNLASGFKSGGFQGQAPTELAAVTPFDQEKALNYEIGYKGRFDQGRSWLHLTGFYTDYKDMQILELVDQPGQEIGVLITQNAAAGVTKGLELELHKQWSADFNLDLSLAYLDARFSEFYFNDSDERAGNYLRNAPKLSGAI